MRPKKAKKVVFKSAEEMPLLICSVGHQTHNLTGAWRNIRPEDFPFHGQFKVRTVNATEIAVKHRLGSMAAPIVNTAIAGAVVKILGLAKLESLSAAIRDGIAIKPEDNVKAAQEAYEKA